MRASLGRLLRFASVGSMGMALQLSLLGTLTGLLNLHYLAATALAVESAIVHNFLWHDRWTWGDRDFGGRKLPRFLRFQGTTGLVSLLGNLAFMKVFVGGLALPPVAGNIASVACCAALNFALNDRVVFAGKLGFDADQTAICQRALPMHIVHDGEHDDGEAVPR